MRKQDELTNSKSCLNKANHNEWVFVLIARDVAAPSTIRFWVEQRIKLKLNEREDLQIQEALDVAHAMEIEYESTRA